MIQFQGFKPDAQKRIAGKLGYTGDMSNFDGYLEQNPEAKQQMDMYKQQAVKMMQGGMVRKFSRGGLPSVNDTSLQLAQEELRKAQDFLASEQAQTDKMIAEGFPVNVDGTNAAKQKVKEAQALFEPGALDAAQKLFTAYNASIQDWVNHQVDTNKMTREEAIAYVIRDKQRNTNFTKGERALAAFTSVYFKDKAQKIEKKDQKGEHVKDSATVSAATVISIYNNTFVQDASSILNGFEQSYVPKKFADQMDKLGGANSPLRNFRFILNPNIGKSVYDLATGKTMYQLSLEQYKLDQVKLIGEAYPLSERTKRLNNAVEKGRDVTIKSSKGISVLDFDDTLATTKSLVRFTTPDGKKGALNAEEYAKNYQNLLAQGYEFDFSEFSKVVGAKLAPLFNKALKLQKKFGASNMFVLTARPADAAQAIFDFLKANGLNIPLKNITGLGNSTSEAKALWVADKVAEGYNDFYFADDALQNVQAVKNMLDQFDVKSKVQRARIKFSKNMDADFNKILRESKGVPMSETVSKAQAYKRGAKKGRFALFLPPSAEDFVGLIYHFLGKGKQGEKHMEFFKQALLTPLNKAYRELNKAKQAIANDYRALKKRFPEVVKKLDKKATLDFTFSDAIRVFLWDRAGFDIPGLSESNINELKAIVEKDAELRAFADTLGIISKTKEGYTAPTEHWVVDDIRNDLANATDKIGRKQFLAEFLENVKVIFSKDNMNKIESIYGTNFREALEDMLYRIENGTNRSFGNNRLVNQFHDWINGSIGATMFFNVRSSVLQTISWVNFINWSDNNVFKAAAAMADQKQFWADFSMIFNSDMLKQRRTGLQTDINAAELAGYVRKSNQPIRASINWLLNKGFLPTQFADSFAIALGGASMYRNRVNTYLNQGMSKQEAEQKAFLDFSEIAEETQQSARPDKISQQQASVLGRLILAFQNTPMQYMRLTKKAIMDLRAGRGDAKTHVSKIIYYTAVQNFIFYALQSAAFALLFGNSDDEEFADKKKLRIANGMMDTVLRGMGVGGAVVSTIKNMIIKFAEQDKKGYNQDESAVLIEMLNLAPPVGIKARKLVTGIKTYNWNKDDMFNSSILDLDNPIWKTTSNVVEATTNVPMARFYNKATNVSEAVNAENDAWQRIALFLGWSKWDVGVESSYSPGPQPRRRKKGKSWRK